MSKDRLKELLCINSRFNYEVYKRLGSNSKRMTKIVNEFGSMDSIADISSLREIVAAITAGEEIYYTTDANRSNTLIYGIWESMFGWTREKCPSYMTPAVEHGLIFYDAVFTDIRFTARASSVTLSPYRRDVIQRHRGVPVFCVGPYIKYAAPYYGDQRFAELKNSLGKTLCVFPAHSTQFSVLSRDERMFVERVKDAARGYDSVLVNAYWWNINDPLVHALESEGFRIVSAGFRDDVLFLSRLRTILELSDAVVGDSIGTHVGYAVSLGLPFRILPSDTQCSLLVTKLPEDRGKAQLYDAFLSKTDSMTPLQAELVEKYWGLSQLKTAQEIECIEEITATIMLDSKKWSQRFLPVAKNVLNEYERTGMSLHYSLLREALGVL